MNNPGPSRTPARATVLVGACCLAIAAGGGLGVLVLGGGDDSEDYPDDESIAPGVRTFDVGSRDDVDAPVDP